MLNLGICPYCGRPFGGRKTRDHVFVRALGGKATVAACSDCNGLISRRLESPLQAAGTMLHLGKLLRGEIDGVLTGTMAETGIAATWNPITGELKPAQTKTADGQSIMGTPDQIRQLLADRGHSNEDIERLISESGRPQPIGETFKFAIAEDLALAQRLVAKVALGAAALVGGRDFLASQLAAELQNVMWAEVEVKRRIHTRSLDAMQSVMSSTLIRAGASQIATLAAPSGRSSVIFAPVGYESVGAYVFLHDLNIGYSGLVVDARMPFGSGLPVQIVDGAPKPVVRMLVDDLAEVLAAGAQRAENNL
jgi:hypothetical protein